MLIKIVSPAIIESIKFMHELPSKISLIQILPEVFNRSFNGIIIFAPVKDTNGEIIDFIYRFMNDTSLKIIGGKKEDYLGKRYLEIFPKAFQLGIFDLYKKVAETGTSMEDDFYYEDENLHEWFRNSVFRSYDSDNIIVYFRIITEKKNLEIGLKKSLDEKEFLLKEIHHRVKNSLQIISSILSIQGMSYENPEINKIIVETQSRINAIALIHEKLYQRGESFQKINLESYVKDLVDIVFHTININKDRIKINCRIQSIEVLTYEGIQLGMILNELITNSIKYAFPDGRHGEINIYIYESGEKITIIVEDNGIGLPEHINIGSSDSLGMLLLDAFAKQLNASVKIERNKGTRFIITFQNSAF